MQYSELKLCMRQLIAHHSFESIYKCIDEISKEDYEFLKTLYAKDKKEKPERKEKKKEVPAAAAQAHPVTQPQEDADEYIQAAPKLRGDAKVRIVKKPTAPSDLPPVTPAVITAVPTKVVTPTVAPVASPAPAPAPASTKQPQQTHTESGFTDPKDIKKWQKEQEDTKKRELEAAGITPSSLLTKDNLKKWIVDEKKTFAYVAREYVGLPDSMVASAAKSYGIQSENSKRRAMIAANKK